MSLAEPYRRAQNYYTIIAAVVVAYTHLLFYAEICRVTQRKQRGRGKHHTSLIMCTSNNSLVERAATSLESSLEKRLALVDVV